MGREGTILILLYHFYPITNIQKFDIMPDLTRADTHDIWGWGWVRLKWDVMGRRGWRLARVLDVQSFFIIITENWVCAMTRNHAESNINILLTRNLPIDSGVRQWSHPLMMQLYCLWAKLNNRARGQFEWDVTCFVFVLISFVHMHDAVVVP